MLACACMAIQPKLEMTALVLADYIQEPTSTYISLQIASAYST